MGVVNLKRIEVERSQKIFSNAATGAGKTETQRAWLVALRGYVVSAISAIETEELSQEAKLHLMAETVRYASDLSLAATGDEVREEAEGILRQVQLAFDAIAGDDRAIGAVLEGACALYWSGDYPRAAGLLEFLMNSCEKAHGMARVRGVLAACYFRQGRNMVLVDLLRAGYQRVSGNEKPSEDAQDVMYATALALLISDQGSDVQRGLDMLSDLADGFSDTAAGSRAIVTRGWWHRYLGASAKAPAQ